MTYSRNKHMIYMYGWVAVWIVSFAQHPTPVLAYPLAVSFSTSSCKNQAHRRFSAVPPSQVATEATEANEVPADDLTKQDLNLRFWEVRDFYRQNPQEKMTQADVCLKLLSTRLLNIRLNRCFVAPSTIKGAGNGLFASRDIANEELITMYPGDAVLIESPSETTLTSESSEDNISGSPPVPPVVGVMFGNHIQGGNRDPNRVSTPEAKNYEMEINPYTSIVADPQIGFDDAAYLGHFANDGAALYEFDPASREAYSKASTECHNSAHFVMEGAHMVTVATKPIAKGEEIYVSYGEGYWLSRSFATSNMDAATKKALIADIAATKSPVSLNGAKPVAKGRQKKKKDAPSKSKNKGFGK